MSNAKQHIDEAYRLLTGEAYKGSEPNDMKPMDGVCVFVMELECLDCTIGPRGHSMFARLADTIQQAYVEITAAKRALEETP